MHIPRHPYRPPPAPLHSLYARPRPELELLALQTSPCRPKVNMVVEEAPPPPKRKTSKQALFEALGGTCQVAPDKKELLGAAEELETSEEQSALRPGLPPPRSLPYTDVNSETFVGRAMRAETEMQVAPPVCEATLQVVVAVDGPAPPRSLWSRTLVSLRGMRTEAKTADWCAVWAGLLCFLALLPLVLTVTDDEQVGYRVPQPMKWGSDPFEAWDWYNGCADTYVLGPPY